MRLAIILLLMAPLCLAKKPPSELAEIRFSDRDGGIKRPMQYLWPLHRMRRSDPRINNLLGADVGDKKKNTNPGQLFPRPSEARIERPEETEALARIQAAKSLCPPPYDVLHQVNVSIVVQDLVIPTSVLRWRTRIDPDNEFLFYAFSENRLTTKNALEGNTDAWTTRQGAKLIQGRDAIEYSIDRTKRTIAFKNFSDAIKFGRHPTYEYVGLGSFPQSVSFPENMNRIFSSIFSRAVRLQVTPGNIKAVLDGRGMEETHEWRFAGAAPTHYSIHHDEREIYSHRVTWENGFPIRLSSSSSSRFQKGKQHIFGKTQSESVMQWLDFDSAKNEDFVRDVIRPAELLLFLEGNQ